MATTLKTWLRCGIKSIFTSATDLGNDTAETSFPDDVTLTNGTGSGQGDRIFKDQRTIGASSDEDLDLAGTLTDSYGSAITFAKIKAIYVMAASANGDIITLGGASANALATLFADTSDKINIKPGGKFYWEDSEDGIAVTASTADLLNVANTDSGASATYDIIIVGTSA